MKSTRGTRAPAGGIDRSNVADASVLVFDKSAFDKILRSSKGGDVIKQLNRLESIKTKNGEQRGFLQLEKDLSSDSQKALYGIKDKIKNIPQ